MNSYYAQKRGLLGRQARCKACCREYERSPEGREIRRRYERSEKGKAKFDRYSASGKRGAARSVWRKTEVGQACRQREKSSPEYAVRQERYNKSEKGRAKRREIALRSEKTDARKAWVAEYKEQGRRHEVQNRYKRTERGRLGSRKDAATRRARATAAGGTYAVAEWLELCQKYGNLCLACGHSKKLEPDHVIPIARGGSSSISNIQPLCRTCNLRKGTKPTDYRSAAVA